MGLREKSAHLTVLTIMSFVLIFIFCSPVFAQFQIISTAPNHGSTEADTSLTMVLVFNFSVDTSYVFEESDFFLNIECNSLNGPPVIDSTTFSQDMRTVNLHLHLQSDTQYQTIISGAKSQGGQMLERPYTFTFTTFTILADGQVSGTITYADGSPWGTLVALYTGNPFEFGDDNRRSQNSIKRTAAAEDVVAISASVVNNANGIYTIDYVPAGTWFPLAGKDVNQDGEFDLSSDVYGWIDEDQNGRPDSYLVTPGASLSDMDIEITSVSHTAQEAFDAMLTLAQNWAADAELFYILGQFIDEDGYAYLWQGEFISETEDSFRVIQGGLGFYQFINEDEALGDTTAALPANWIDSSAASDTAFSSADDFLQTYPDCQKLAELGWVDPADPFPDFLIGSTRIYSEPCNAHAFNGRRISNKHLLPNDALQPMWRYTFLNDETGDWLIVLMDPANAQVINFYTSEPSTARHAFPQVLSNAQDWAGDAQFFYAGAEYVQEDGTSLSWWYQFYSESQDSVLTIVSSGDIVTVSEGHPAYADTTTSIQDNWIDSDVAADSGFSTAQDFILTHPDYHTELNLTWVNPEDPMGFNGELRKTRMIKEYQKDILLNTLAEYSDNNKFSKTTNAQILHVMWEFKIFDEDGNFLLIYMHFADASVQYIYSNEPTTAIENINTIAARAQNWYEDAILTNVAADAGFEVDSTGRSESWVYSFRSASVDTGITYIYFGSIPFFTFLGAGTGMPGFDPQIVVDSDVAITIAENNGGSNYRRLHEDPYIIAEIINGVNIGLPEKIIWFVDYYSSVDPEELYFNIDAVTGEILEITGFESLPTNTVPAEFRLNENYPNPFNANTVISYELAVQAHVRLVIFSMTGRQVIELVNQTQKAGAHKITWNGKDEENIDLPSGIYFLRIQAGSFSTDQKLTICK